ncbi:NAD(P)H-binding protein [Sphingomonas sp. Leaf62]|uniref:NAD(P)H-binding protein n=1 Tax=Sphingomonas sp. Leaf62 TaxID=1736228 RepID=UPI0009EC0A39|nr:NAD(P)H-binding protein [Sphingomonas sp. Leaf62]
MGRIGLIGASGNGGACILKKRSDRGHSVTAIARRVDRITTLPGITALYGDMADAEQLASLLARQGAVVGPVQRRWAHSTCPFRSAGQGARFALNRLATIARTNRRR